MPGHGIFDGARIGVDDGCDLLVDVEPPASGGSQWGLGVGIGWPDGGELVMAGGPVGPEIGYQDENGNYIIFGTDPSERLRGLGQLTIGDVGVSGSFGPGRQWQLGRSLPDGGWIDVGQEPVHGWIGDFGLDFAVGVAGIHLEGRAGGGDFEIGGSVGIEL